MTWAENVLELLAVGLAFALTIALIVLLDPLSRRIGLVDRPGGRKDHDHSTPSTGGIALAVGLGLPSLFLFASSAAVAGLLLAGTIILISGILDDLVDLHWAVRVIVQLFAGLIMIVVGDTSVQHLGDIFGVHAAALPSFTSYALTLFATVGLINAINMIDGIDGLAGSLVIVALGLACGAALYSGNQNLAFGLVLIISGIMGFLVFNLRTPWRKTARAFLGNSGSGLLGLIVAWVCFRLTQDPSHPISPVLAPYFIAVPVIDCLSLIYRRTVKKISPFAADRNHIHHVLLDAGFRPSDVVAILTLLSATIGLSATLAVWLGVPHEVLPVAFFALTAGYTAYAMDEQRLALTLSRLHRRYRSLLHGLGELDQDRSK